MKQYDSVKTLVETKGWDDVVVPAGTVGAITDVLDGGYAVDVFVDGEPNQIFVRTDQVEAVIGR